MLSLFEVFQLSLSLHTEAFLFPQSVEGNKLHRGQYNKGICVFFSPRNIRC